MQRRPIVICARPPRRHTATLPSRPEPPRSLPTTRYPVPQIIADYLTHEDCGRVTLPSLEVIRNRVSERIDFHSKRLSFWSGSAGVAFYSSLRDLSCSELGTKFLDSQLTSQQTIMTWIGIIGCIQIIKHAGNLLESWQTKKDFDSKI